MNQILDAMFDVGYPMLLAFTLGVMFGTRVIRTVLIRRLTEMEVIPDGGRSKDSRDTAPVSRSS